MQYNDLNDHGFIDIKHTDTLFFYVRFGNYVEMTKFKYRSNRSISFVIEYSINFK